MLGRSTFLQLLSYRHGCKTADHETTYDRAHEINDDKFKTESPFEFFRGSGGGIVVNTLVSKSNLTDCTPNLRLDTQSRCPVISH